MASIASGTSGDRRVTCHRLIDRHRAARRTVRRIRPCGLVSLLMGHPRTWGQWVFGPRIRHLRHPSRRTPRQRVTRRSRPCSRTIRRQNRRTRLRRTLRTTVRRLVRHRGSRSWRSRGSGGTPAMAGSFRVGSHRISRLRDGHPRLLTPTRPLSAPGRSRLRGRQRITHRRLIVLRPGTSRLAGPGLRRRGSRTRTRSASSSLATRRLRISRLVPGSLAVSRSAIR